MLQTILEEAIKEFDEYVSLADNEEVLKTMDTPEKLRDYVKKFLINYITKSYEAGRETGKEDAVDEFMKPAGMKFFAKCVDTINERIKENARKETRQKLLKEIEGIISQATTAENILNQLKTYLKLLI